TENQWKSSPILVVLPAGLARRLGNSSAAIEGCGSFIHKALDAWDTSPEVSYGAHSTVAVNGQLKPTASTA
ncbi:hypothetical protein N9B23_02535, partial [bacterium]|nr:hypothetical protein [bacterium]